MMRGAPFRSGDTHDLTWFGFTVGVLTPVNPGYLWSRANGTWCEPIGAVPPDDGVAPVDWNPLPLQAARKAATASVPMEYVADLESFIPKFAPLLKSAFG